jgi:hypothetical protein
MDGKTAKGPPKPQKPVRNAPNRAKNSKFRIAHLPKGVPRQEKSARTLAPGPVASQKSPKIHPQNAPQKVIHNRRLT